MKTDIAIPEEPEDRCIECGATFQYHNENPGGVRYPVPQSIKFSFEPDEVAPWDITFDVRVCYVYKLGL